ncbi:MAG: nitroreductase family deazaflavin-dependent oxidoreductase [Chloroflexi bacterium]|nr:nitroreductase family deazaflavin-dependent oxidoreductase [Chloroflexota bacterium]
MAGTSFSQALQGHREVSITVKGRRTGKSITLPVWFVQEGETVWLLPVKGSRTQWFRNLVAEPTVTLQVGCRRHTARARTFADPLAVQPVAQKFQAKYTPGEIARYYAALDAAVEIPLAA